VDLVGEGFHALREFAGVWDEIAGAVAGFGGPAVVDVDVCIPGVFETETDECFCGVESYRCGSCRASTLILGRVSSEP
jgi:hypothetical protein